MSGAERESFDRLWTKRDVAACLGVNVRTVERLPIPRVNIRVEKDARPIVRFDPVQVREWIEARKTRRSA